MAESLLAEFDAGRLAHIEGVTECPYLATSNSADAWHAGRAFEVRCPTDFVLRDVTHGRGYRINVLHDKSCPARWPKLVYLIDYRASAAPVVQLVEGFGA